MRNVEMWVRILVPFVFAIFILVPFIALFDYRLPPVPAIEAPANNAPVRYDPNNPFMGRPPNVIAIEAVPDDTPLPEVSDEYVLLEQPESPDSFTYDSASGLPEEDHVATVEEDQGMPSEDPEGAECYEASCEIVPESDTNGYEDTKG